MTEGFEMTITIIDFPGWLLFFWYAGRVGVAVVCMYAGCKLIRYYLNGSKNMHISFKDYSLLQAGVCILVSILVFPPILHVSCCLG
jgi:hypothetical protein